MVVVGAYTLSEQDYDARDFLAGNVLKNLDKIKEPKKFMRGISETYEQGGLGSCTAMGTSHSLKSQNEKEHKKKIEIKWKDLRSKMGHSLTKKDGGDSVEKAVKTALKEGISGSIDGKDHLFKSDARCYGLRDIWRKAITITPLIVIFDGDGKTRMEMSAGEITTIKKGKLGHCVLLCGFDENYVYFYNSRGDRRRKKGISNFKVSRKNFEEAIKTRMINWRWFGLIDKKDIIDYGVEIEFSKQLIQASKRLYAKGDSEMKKKFEERGITKYLEAKYGFKYE